MSERYNTTLGFYEPSIFHLYTRGDGSLSDMQNWETQQASTFLHEYIHYLQDITTVKGLQNLYIIGEYLRLVTKNAKSQGYCLKRPITPHFSGDNVGNNWKVSFYTQGEKSNVAVKYHSFSRDFSKQIVDDQTGKTITIGRILVSCGCIDGSIKQFCFGTSQIMEGMAKMIQESVFLALRKSPYNPYYIAIDLANDILTGLGNNKLTMIAIFDYSLQSSNPGWAFVNYIEEKKKQGYSANTLTYEIVYKDMENAVVQSNTSGLTSLKNGFEDIVKQAKGVFKDYAGGAWQFKSLTVWYNTLLERGKVMRAQLPYFFVDLARGGDIRKYGVFSNVYSIFGTPIVTNRKHEFDFHQPKNLYIKRDDLMHVYAMMQIHRVFKSKGPFTCPLRKYCQNQPCGIRKQCVDVRCVKAPWERMRRYNRCLFNTWWFFKGFKKVKFV